MMTNLPPPPSMDPSVPSDMWEDGLRPDYLKLDNPVTIATNFVTIKSAPKIFYCYNVEFGSVRLKNESGEDVACNPSDVEEKVQILSAISSHPSLAGKNYAFLPNAKILFSTEILGQLDGSEPVLVDIAFQLNNGLMSVITSVKLIPTGTMTFSNRASNLVGIRHGAQHSAELLAALNAFVQRYALSQQDIIKAGSNKFFSLSRVPYVGGDLDPLMARHGYSLNVRATECGIGVNINTTTTCFINHKTRDGRSMLVSEVIDKIQQKHQNGLDRKELDKLLSALLYGVQVKVILFKDSPHSFKKIKSIQSSVESQMVGKQTVSKLFRQKFDFEIRRPDLPCVELACTYRELGESIGWYPPEVLTIIPHQSANSRLQQLYVSSIIKIATRRAVENRDRICKDGIPSMGLENVTHHRKQGPTLTSLGFQISDRLVEFDATVLQAPTVFYANNVKARITEASWNLRDVRRFFSDENFRNLKYLFVLRVVRVDTKLKQDRSQDEAEERKWQNFRHTLSGQLTRHGSHINLENIKDREIEYAPDEIVKFEKDLRAAFDRLIRMKPFVLIALPDEDKAVYGTIKRLAELCYGYTTTAFVFSKYRENDLSYLSNIICKMNLKLGGTCHTPFTLASLPSLKIERLDKVIVMGADVVHRTISPNERGYPSIASVVGSTDKTFARYLASVRVQRSRQERIQDLEQMVRERLLDWQQANKGETPEGILFYRDGVGESQIETIRDIEIPAIFSAWEGIREFSSGKKLRLNFVIVTKRHAVRFYPNMYGTTKTPQDKGTNVVPGLAVDRSVTHPFAFNFFLQPHKAIQGTARPAHYTVLRNDLKLHASQMINVTHWLCYALGRATKGISYAAPTFLADICCDHASHWLEFEPVAVKDVHETRDEFADRCLMQFLEENEQWNRADRPGPWHKNLDNVMFWT